MKRVLLAFLLFTCTARAANADELEPARAALAADRPNEAIAELESLGDRGTLDAAVSFDRGLAYAARVRAGGEQPGDLGRASHGFEEAKSLSHSRELTRDATKALGIVRAEIARRRARAGETAELDDGMSLGRSIVELLPENVWSVLGAAFAAVLSLAILVAVRASARRARVSGGTAAVIAGVLLASSALIVQAARDARMHLREGVVTITARVLDERHVAIDGAAPIYEGSRVRVLEEGAEYTHVATNTVDGLLPSSAVLAIAKH